MNVEYMNPNDLIPYSRNAKLHPVEQVEHIANSIKMFGWTQPIVVDESNVVVIGHGRLMAAKLLKLDKVPVVRRDDLTEEQINACRLADNKTNESDWDFSKLDEELAVLDFAGLDMDLFGFEVGEDFIDHTQEIVEDEAPEMQEEAVAKLGQIYQLGGHRLMCGDSTDEETINRLMDGEKAELLLTDPPYGINVVKKNEVGGGGALHFKGVVHGKGGKNRIVESSEYFPIIGDDTTDSARENYEIAKEHTENQVIFGGNYFTDFLFPSRCWVVWDKQNTGNFADAELAWTSFDKGVKLYHFMWNGLAREGSRKVEGVTRVHPTQKPVGLMAKILSDFCSDGGLVLDCFGGSGSTLIACEQTGRNCYMMELDPHYVDVIIKRWENLTGKKAVLLNEPE